MDLDLNADFLTNYYKEYLITSTNPKSLPGTIILKVFQVVQNQLIIVKGNSDFSFSCVSFNLHLFYAISAELSIYWFNGIWRPFVCISPANKAKIALLTAILKYPSCKPSTHIQKTF